MHHDITITNDNDFAHTGSKVGFIDALRGVGDKVAGSVHAGFVGSRHAGTILPSGERLTADRIEWSRSASKGEATFAATLATRHQIARRLRDLGVERGDEYMFALAVYRKVYATSTRRFHSTVGRRFTLTITLADMEAQRGEMLGCDRRLRPAYRPGPIAG